MVARISGRLMNASHRLIPACSDVCRPTSSPLPTITTRKTAAVSATATATCKIRLRRRGTVSFLPDTTRSVVSSMALNSVLLHCTVADPPADFHVAGACKTITSIAAIVTAQADEGTQATDKSDGTARGLVRSGLLVPLG